MILCGWCGRSTPEGEACVMCHHADPPRPYLQRGLGVPRVDVHEGRPTLVPADVARRLAHARAELEREGRRVTVESLAEVMDISARTVRRWQQMAG